MKFNGIVVVIAVYGRHGRERSSKQASKMVEVLLLGNGSMPAREDLEQRLTEHIRHDSQE